MVILTAVNSKYYHPGFNTIKNVQLHFPNIKLIIYDLGLTAKMRDHVVAFYVSSSLFFKTYMVIFLKVQEVCKCELVEFDKDHLYRKTSAHISNLITYSWKPLIIQVRTRSHFR